MFFEEKDFLGRVLQKRIEEDEKGIKRQRIENNAYYDGSAEAYQRGQLHIKNYKEYIVHELDDGEKRLYLVVDQEEDNRLYNRQGLVVEKFVRKDDFENTQQQRMISTSEYDQYRRLIQEERFIQGFEDENIHQRQLLRFSNFISVDNQYSYAQTQSEFMEDISPAQPYQESIHGRYVSAMIKDSQYDDYFRVVRREETEWRPRDRNIYLHLEDVSDTMSANMHLFKKKTIYDYQKFNETGDVLSLLKTEQDLSEAGIPERREQVVTQYDEHRRMIREEKDVSFSGLDLVQNEVKEWQNLTWYGQAENIRTTMRGQGRDVTVRLEERTFDTEQREGDIWAFPRKKL